MFEDLSNQIFNESIQQLEKKENKQRIQDLFINPVVSNIQKTIYPYIYSLLILFILILIVLIIIFHKVFCSLTLLTNHISLNKIPSESIII